MNKNSISEVMRQMGRKGGKKRFAGMTAAERTALAKKGAAKSAAVRSKKAATNKTALERSKLAAPNKDARS